MVQDKESEQIKAEVVANHHRIEMQERNRGDEKMAESMKNLEFKLRNYIPKRLKGKVVGKEGNEVIYEQGIIDFTSEWEDPKDWSRNLKISTKISGPTEVVEEFMKELNLKMPHEVISVILGKNKQLRLGE